jgi:hypothetical protein
MSERLAFRYSPRGQLGLIAVGCALVAASWFAAVTHPDVVYRTVGWLGVGLFALCIVIAAKRLITGGVPFVFDLSGIAFPTGSFGLLPWTEIKSYAVVTVRGNHFLQRSRPHPCARFGRETKMGVRQPTAWLGTLGPFVRGPDSRNGRSDSVYPRTLVDSAGGPDRHRRYAMIKACWNDDAAEPDSR